MGMSFDRRLAVLAAICMGPFVTAGLLAVLSLAASDQQAVRTLEYRNVGSAQAHADMMHNALRADSYAGAAASTEERRTAVRDEAVLHAERAQQDMRAVEQGMRRLGEPTAAASRARSELATFAGHVLATLRAATGPTATSTAELTALESEFAGLERSMAALSHDIATRDRASVKNGATTRDRYRQGSVVVGLLGLLAIVLVTRNVRHQVRTMIGQRDTAEEERELLSVATQQQSIRHEFKNRLHDALDMADKEPQVHDVLRRAVEVASDGQPVELLLADSSRAHLDAVVTHPSAGGPGCPVESPWDCVAVRRGQTVIFDSSEQVNACPMLRDRPDGPCSAVCVPVAFMGRALGVLHTTGPVDGPMPDGVAERLTVIATEGGTRIGTLRALAKSQLQANVDGLTGLPNRRSTEEEARDLLRRHPDSAVAMADLDHFKLINDTIGHEGGDRALRMFASAIRAALRPEDLFGRYGGEEFLLILPGCTAEAAGQALDRARAALAALLREGSSPPFTVSFGVSAVGSGITFEDAVSAADMALLQAKAEGRDRVVLAGARREPLSLAADTPRASGDR